MYKHTQRGDVIIVSTVIAAAITFPSMLFAGPLIALLATAGIVGVLALFWSLTVTVDSETVRIHFGPGLIRFSWARADILSAQAATTPWYYGWGLRFYNGGWLYNVSGTESVELSLQGSKNVRIGTDDVEGLLAAIRAS